MSDKDINAFISGYNLGWSFRLNNYSNEKNRIRFMWDTNYWQFNIISRNQQAIFEILQNLGGLEIILTAVYGLHSQEQSKELWDHLKFIAQYDCPLDYIRRFQYSTL